MPLLARPARRSQAKPSRSQPDRHGRSQLSASQVDPSQTRPTRQAREIPQIGLENVHKQITKTTSTLRAAPSEPASEHSTEKNPCRTCNAACQKEEWITQLTASGLQVTSIFLIVHYIGPLDPRIAKHTLPLTSTLTPTTHAQRACTKI